jgi:hyaluronoglucosaminidase
MNPIKLLLGMVGSVLLPLGAEEPRATDDPGNMPYYTGRIYPTPQQATYGETFIPLGNVAVLAGKDATQSEPLIKLLVDRITRYGGKATPADVPADEHQASISLGDTPVSRQVKGVPEVPNREQGYVLATGEANGKPVAVLKGHDRLGFLWAISSFNQLVHRRDGKPVARAATVQDFPAALNRGYLHGNIGGFSGQFTAEQSMLFNVSFKFNKPVYKHLSFNYYTLKELASLGSKLLWRDKNAQSDDCRRNIERIGQLLTPLGIQWYGGFHPVIGPVETKWHGSPEDIETLLYYGRQVAKAGGHFYVQLDDFRFPLHPYDQEHFKTAAKADAYILTELLKGLQKDFPKTRIMVCPPFYWGPTAPSDEWYGEPRDDYLLAMGQLPPAVEVQWTGPKVTSNVVLKEHVDWITERIKRKPVYWQNSWESPHPNSAHYVTDPVRSWPEWYYDGFVSDVDCQTYNGGPPGDMVLFATIADYFWNPKAYDAEASVAEAARKIAGPECYDTLVKLNQALSTFDPYGFVVSPAAARDVDKLEAKAAEAEQLWKEILAQSKAAGVYTALGAVADAASRYVKTLRSNPKLKEYVEQAETVREDAVKEAKLDEKTDQLLTPYDFVGGYGPRPYANRCPLRLSVWIYGTNTAWKAASARFRVEPFPSASKYELIVSGQDDEADNPCGIRIRVNGKTIYEGKCPFARLGWSTHTFAVPAEPLRHENTLVFENTAPGYHGGPPWFMVNYVVVRRTD